MFSSSQESVADFTMILKGSQKTVKNHDMHRFRSLCSGRSQKLRGSLVDL